MRMREMGTNLLSSSSARSLSPKSSFLTPSILSFSALLHFLLTSSSREIVFCSVAALGRAGVRSEKETRNDQDDHEDQEGRAGDAR